MRPAVEQRLDVADVQDTTRERYEDLIRLYILPTFGDTMAAKLDAELLERFYAIAAVSGPVRGRRGGGHVCRPLSSSTVRKVHFILSASLERAVRWRHLGVNKRRWPSHPRRDRPIRTRRPPPRRPRSSPRHGRPTMVTGCRRGKPSLVVCVPRRIQAHRHRRPAGHVLPDQLRPHTAPRHPRLRAGRGHLGERAHALRQLRRSGSAVRTGEPTFDRVFGRPYFEHLVADPAAGRVWQEGMACFSGMENAPIAHAYSFPAGARVIDVGGGQGGFLAEVLATDPSLRGVLFDLPEVVEAPRVIQDAQDSSTAAT